MVTDWSMFWRVNSWQRFWKLMHKGFSNLICLLSGPFLQVRLIIQHCFFFFVWFDSFMISGVIISWHLRFYLKYSGKKQTKKALNFNLSLASRCIQKSRTGPVGMEKKTQKHKNSLINQRVFRNGSNTLIPFQEWIKLNCSCCTFSIEFDVVLFLVSFLCRHLTNVCKIWDNSKKAWSDILALRSSWKTANTTKPA